MKKIKVLIVVDADGALASNNLVDNVYIIDTNKFLGSWNEGQCDLHTVCQDQQNISWAVVGLSEDDDVSITGFSGAMVTEKVCIPQKVGMSSDISWEGRIETQGSRGRYAYTVSLSIDGSTPMSFSPYIDVE